MRISLVVYQFPPQSFTGTESCALAIGDGRWRRGHEVDGFALDPALGEVTGPRREPREVVDGLPVRTPRVVIEPPFDGAGVPALADSFGRLHHEVRDGGDGESFTPGHADHLGRRRQRPCGDPEPLALCRAAVRRPREFAAAVGAFEPISRGALRR